LIVFIFGLFWGINLFYPGTIYYFGIALVIIIGGFLLIKGFGVDRSAKDFYHWVKDYSPPPLPMQISNYTIFAGILCVAISVYLGIASVYTNLAPFPANAGGCLAKSPVVATFFIKGIETLLVVGLIIILFGRSVRLYFERDSKLLRNVALVVSVAWSYWILDGTANVLIHYYNDPSSPFGISDQYFSAFIYAIIVGILIGIASILLIVIINRSSKDFFQKSERNPTEKEEKPEL
jgi:uncharacterized membrane protein